METHIALVWTKASISHCEQMNMQLGIMDGRRLYSIICLPLSTIERLTNHEKEVQERSSVRHLLPFVIVSYQSQNCSSYRVPRVQTSSTLSALTGLWWGLSLEVEELSREKQTCDQKQAVIWWRHTFSGKSLIDQSSEGGKISLRDQIRNIFWW